MAEIDVKKQEDILQKQSLGRVLQESCSKIFGKAYRKTHVKQPFLKKSQDEGLQLYSTRDSCIGFFL